MANEILLRDPNNANVIGVYDEIAEETRMVRVNRTSNGMLISIAGAPDSRYDYDGDGNCIYKGEHETIDAATSDTSWYIHRYDYDGDNNVTRKRFRITSWDARASGW